MDYEKIYNTLIQIIADRENVIVTTKVERKWSQMKKTKKYKWNKAKFAVNILKLELIAGIALIYDVMFIAYLLK